MILFENLLRKQAMMPKFINFENSEIKRICIENWDKDGDGRLSVEEANAVRDIGEKFSNNKNITNLKDFQHFRNVRKLNNAFSYCTGLLDIKFWNGVEEINNNCIAYCQRVRLIDFPSTIKRFGLMLLRYPVDKNKFVMICRAKTPPLIHSYSENMRTNALYVPEESVELYRNDKNITTYLSTNILPLSENHP